MGVVVGFAGPNGGFVELDALVAGAAEDHGAHAAVSDRQGFHPELGRLLIPKNLCWCGEREEGQQGNNAGGTHKRRCPGGSDRRLGVPAADNQLFMATGARSRLAMTRSIMPY